MSDSGDWAGRILYPDIYPRKDDPFQPPAAGVPLDAPAASQLAPQQSVSVDVYSPWVTEQGVRPVVYQRALNFQLAVGLTPIQITNGQFQCDAIVVDNPSSNGNSVFFGYGSGITATSGIEIFPGVPLVFSPTNSRIQWEIQRAIESIAAMMADQLGYGAVGKGRDPRVAINANEYSLVGPVAGPTTVAIMLFLIPEMQ